MARIPKAYDTVLCKYVSPNEIENTYQKGQKRYQCPKCFDWLSFANTERRQYFKHWRTSDGHDDCDLYYSQYYNSNSVQSELSKKLRQSKGIGYALYLEKRNFEWCLSLGLPAFSGNDIFQFERNLSYIKIKALDFGTDIMLNISRDNFVPDERRNIILSQISDEYEVVIGTNGKETAQKLSGAKLEGVVFQFVGSENIENDDQILAKKLQSGSKIHLQKHYLLFTKVLPKAEYLNGLSLKEIDSISIKIGGLDKTRKIYDFVIFENTWNADKFCKKYGLVLSEEIAETQIMWPPIMLFRDDYLATSCNNIMFYSDSIVESNGKKEKLRGNLYRISMVENNVRIAVCDQLYNINFIKGYVAYSKKIECLYNRVEENKECLYANNLIFYNNVLISRQKENTKIIEKMALLQYKSNYLISEIIVSVNEKEKSQVTDLLNAIRYCKVMITTPYWIRKIDLTQYDKNAIEYIDESIARKSICREVVRMLSSNL